MARVWRYLYDLWSAARRRRSFCFGNLKACRDGRLRQLKNLFVSVTVLLAAYGGIAKVLTASPI